MKKELSVLFVDDEVSFIDQLIRSIEKRVDNISFVKASTSAEAMAELSRAQFDVAIVDLSLDSVVGPDSGIELITDILDRDPSLRVIVLTGHNSEGWGVQAIRAGAASFVSKPVDADHLLALINDASNVTSLQRRIFGREIGADKGYGALAGLSSNNQQMQRVLQLVSFAAATEQPVLLCGETGVGKGVIARAIHDASSRRSANFVRLSPHYGSHDIILSELCGHVKGSFTGAISDREGRFAEADGGTLFIDEVDCLPQSTQVALLELLQEGYYYAVGSNKRRQSNFRLICATNCPQDRLITKDALRLDFYHRIAHLLVRIPPLRERKEDIYNLAKGFLDDLIKANRKSVVRDISPEAVRWLENETWPGNVRELQAVLERGFHCASFHESRSLKIGDFKMLGMEQQGDSGESSAKSSLEDQLREVEQKIVKGVYDELDGNLTATAQVLKTDRKRISRVINRQS